MTQPKVESQEKDVQQLLYTRWPLKVRQSVFCFVTRRWIQEADLDEINGMAEVGIILTTDNANCGFLLNKLEDLFGSQPY